MITELFTLSQKIFDFTGASLVKQSRSRFFPHFRKSLRLSGFLIATLSLVVCYQALSSHLTLAAATTTPLIHQGEKVTVNGKQMRLAWSQWREADRIHTGVSDTGAMLNWGIELLSTAQSNMQPVRWFFPKPWLVPTRIENSYRYLDLTNLLEHVRAQIKVVGDKLEIQLPSSLSTQVTQTTRLWSDRISVTLNHATFWRVTQEGNEVVIHLVGGATSNVLQDFQPPVVEEVETQVEGETQVANFLREEPSLGMIAIGQPEVETKRFVINPFAPRPVPIITSDGISTQIRIKIRGKQGVQVWSEANPPRLNIDVRRDPVVKRDITWTPGLIWHQGLVSLLQGEFPVTWLEVNLGSPDLNIKPLIGNPDGVQGTEPLLKMGRKLNAYAAINGGFFNRNNQLPLGALRRNQRWLSGPILNRGAMAWDNKNARFERLFIQENLITSSGKVFPIPLLNSAYVQAGIARYTRDWGQTYTPLTEHEILVWVQGNSITQKLELEEAGKEDFAIPEDGYLLALRAFKSAAPSLTVGTNLRLESNTFPRDFDRYPNIMGAGPLLLKDQRLVLDGKKENFSHVFNRQSASRSAIGITRGGTLVLATFHNRLGGRGVTLRETAQLMQRLGAVDALNLDGGSSTSLYLGGQIIDRPANTAARVSNGIGIFGQ